MKCSNGRNEAHNESGDCKSKNAILREVCMVAYTDPFIILIKYR